MTETDILEIGLMLEEKGLSHSEIDSYFEHHGVKGQKWGVRRARNRELNRAAKSADRTALDKSIDKARAKKKSGAVKAEFQKAKSQHAANKAKLGSYEARKILRKARAKKANTLQTANLAKKGKETTLAWLAIGGLTGMSVLFTQMAKRA